MAGRLLHLTFVLQFKVDLSSSDDTNRRGGSWIHISLVQPAVVIAYLCIPRAIFNLAVTRSELPLNAGVLDRKLAYAAAILLAYRLFWIRWPQFGNRLVRWWLHAECAAGVIEAGALYYVGVGFSPLFIHHADWAAVAIALRQHGWLIVAGIVTMIGMDRLLSWTLRQQHTFSTTARWALVIVALFGVRSIERLYVDGVTQESPVLGLAVNLRNYANRRAVTAHLRVLESERDVLRQLGVAPLGAHYQSTVVPPEPLNLITIFIEGGQANFSAPWQPERSVITPNLDRFARRSIRFENFYNAVTPTINALISSHCGVISEVENNHLRLDRGYTRELSCLSDWLHNAGYYQVFMGGADAEFSGKNLFLSAHEFDEVVGWAEWRKETTRRHDWGLHDTDLVRQAVRRLDDLKARAPFHLSILTVNTHPPGFVAPDCPDSEQNPSLLLAVRCTDTAVGMLLDELESRGYFKNSVIAVLGDHTVMPSADNLKALQGDLVGWFGKVYMALWYPDVSPRVVKTVGYTPDFAPLVLDALNFDPVPLFQFGRSTMRDADFQRTLVARHFQVVDGEMHPREPTLMDNCDLRQLEQTIIDTKDSAILSSCERQRLVQIVEHAAESGECLLCQR